MRHFDTTRASEARKRKIVMISKNGIRKEFDSIKDAAKETGLHEPCICRCCKGKQGLTGGLRFVYVPIPVVVPITYLNLKEAAEKCGLSEQAMKYKAKDLGIEKFRQGGKRWYFKESDIELAISKDLFRDRRKRRKSIILDNDFTK